MRGRRSRPGHQALWCLVFLGGAFSAWRAGWIPISIESAQTGQVSPTGDSGPTWQASRKPGTPSGNFQAPRTRTDAISRQDVTAPVATQHNRKPPVILSAALEETALPRLAEIDTLIQDGDIARAHTALSQIYFRRTDRRDEIQQQIDETARQIYFAPRPHIMAAYTIRPGDSLGRIAPRYGVGWRYLARLNHTSPKKIRAGQRLKVVRGPFGVEVNLRRLQMVVRSGNQYVCRFSIGIGRDNSTPRGRFRVLRKTPQPQYTDPEGRVIAAGSPDNPLGNFWIDLGESYGIHGTNNPSSIGRARSRGCIRLHNKDIEQLYGMLITGSEVVIGP